MLGDVEGTLWSVSGAMTQLSSASSFPLDSRPPAVLPGGRMTIKEVARRTGVSTATVTRVLNGAIPVKGSTRRRVLKAVEELKYHPNLNARSLACGNTSAVGVLVSNLANPFFLDIVQRIESHLRMFGQEMIVTSTSYRTDKLIAGVRQMIGHRVNGLVILASETAPVVLDLLNAYGAPSVVLDGANATGTAASISIDYRKGAERVIRLLHDLGHRSFAIIGHQAIRGSTSMRCRAFEETIASFPCVQCRTVLCPDSLEGGREATRELFNIGFRPTAIIGLNDFIAVGVLRELRERGLSVPRDVSVIGFDNIPLTEFCEPRLTTVHIPRDEIAVLAASWLTVERDLLPGRNAVINPDLILRESTGHPATAWRR